ncbi:DUF4145 domain-containing protein [Acidisphaera sp. L21]|uniref:DUF4145 domain-containing protein n=1 Tax=Acidisphaera sp. L21 TaxID=1641851 RepID=UPI00131AC11D|nr:DUF4145 domain-containing protein [Acidisphaera sp. L21]
MPPAYIAPDTIEAFNCPHCGALAHQDWFRACAYAYEKGSFPWKVRDDLDDWLEEIKHNPDFNEATKTFFRKKKTGKIFPHVGDGSNYYAKCLENLDVSKCFSCEQFSVWRNSNLIFPHVFPDIKPNEDMPDDVRVDFEEAAQILTSSPRGSAALLRLAAQKLCKHLGEKGKNINDDIAAMVTKGLDVRIQKSLDVVRIVGNDSVHPGQIDVRDNPEMAKKLFGLINVIVDTMITRPKHIDQLFGDLPEGKRAEIAKRDTSKS